jgi:DNA end-binding protein Ku
VPRSVFNRIISFGLVAVPVKAFAATHDRAVHFHQLEKGTGSRIRYRKVSEKTSKDVEAADIESGYEVARGRYVVVQDDDLEALAPKASNTIEVGEFVDLHQIDPVYYDRTYWLVPDGDTAARPYSLLQNAMERVERVGIGTVVVRNKQYLAAVRPIDDALALSTMRFAEEVVPSSDIDELSALPKPTGKELDLAVQIVESLKTDWDPGRYHDTYTEMLRHLIERRERGEEVVVGVETPAPSATVLDLTKALEESLAAARKRGSAASKPAKRSAGHTSNRQPAKRGSTSKASGTSRRRKSA